MRSFLIAAADDEAALAAALRSAADAVVIDLDAAAGRRAAARANAARALAGADRAGDKPLIVRVSPLESGETDADLDGVMAAAPFAILLPRTRGAADVQQLSAKLAVREALHAIQDGATAIIASIGTAQGLLAAGRLGGSSARLVGLARDAEAIAADVGARGARDRDGLAAPLRTARDLTLLAAAAAGIRAIDTTFAGPSESGRLDAETAEAFRAGFAAKLALDPGEASAINAAFTRLAGA
jgi:citrate lyase subunit beta/citryl-CoA lyase